MTLQRSNRLQLRHASTDMTPVWWLTNYERERGKLSSFAGVRCVLHKPCASRVCRRWRVIFVAMVLVGVLSPGQVLSQEKPVAPEINPPGDIPDSQVFVTYASPLSFSLKVPEGWGREDRQDGARFADKYDSVDISVAQNAARPTVQSARTNEAAALQGSDRAVEIVAIKSVRLPAGEAVLVSYKSNSEPNAVTGKQVRLEHDRYLLYKAGQLAALDLSAPAGADNADQWKLMAESFRWR